MATAVLVEGEPIPSPDEHDAVRWLRAEQLASLDWLPADRPFLPEIEALVSGGPD